MCNLYTKFVKFLEICKQLRFSDLEVIALSMAAETEEIDSENWLFEARLKEYRGSIPNLISRRQFNDRRKTVSGIQEQIRSRMAQEMDGGEDYFCIDSKPIEVCRVARGKRCKMGRDGDFAKATGFGYCISRKNIIHFVDLGKMHFGCKI